MLSSTHVLDFVCFFRFRLVSPPSWPSLVLFIEFNLTVFYKISVSAIDAMLHSPYQIFAVLSGFPSCCLLFSKMQLVELLHYIHVCVHWKET